MATIAVPILVVVLLNLGLYTQLAPKPPQSLYGSAHRASLIQMSLRDWIVLGGRWKRRDVMISQENDQPEDLGIIAPLRMAPGDAFRVSVGLWLEQEAQGGGILFDVQRPTSHLGSQLVRLHWARRPLLDRTLSAVFLVLLGVCTAIFVNWAFLG